MAVQSCMEWIPIKKKESKCEISEEIEQKLIKYKLENNYKNGLQSK